jgi:hypothetical protein
MTAKMAEKMVDRGSAKRPLGRALLFVGGFAASSALERSFARNE